MSQVSEHLGLYVYLLVDPRDWRPFYVGKGRGVRMSQHGLQAEDTERRTHSARVARIQDIRAAGLEHEIWIVRYSLTLADYTAVEAAVIDVLASFPITPARRRSRYRPLERRDELTNRRREDARNKGMILLDRLVDEFAAAPLTTTQPLLLITLRPWEDLIEAIAGNRTRPGNGFKREWLDSELRNRDARLLEMATSSRWVISPRQVQRRGVRYAVPVFRGVTRGLLEIRADSWEQLSGRRWGFVGKPILAGDLFEEVVGRHGHRVPGKQRGSQNPVYYWPRG